MNLIFLSAESHNQGQSTVRTFSVSSTNIRWITLPVNIIPIAIPLLLPYNYFMKFDVLITRIGNPKAGNIISKHIAHETGVSIQVALSQLGNLPVAYSSGVNGDTAKLLIRQLEKIGVTAHVAEVQPPMPPRHASYLVDKPARKPQVVEPVPASMPATLTPVPAPIQTPLPEIPPVEEPIQAVPSG